MISLFLTQELELENLKYSRTVALERKREGGERQRQRDRDRERHRERERQRRDRGREGERVIDFNVLSVA